MKSTEERSTRKPRNELPTDLSKLPPLNRIPRKSRLPKDARDWKRSFSSISKDQTEASHRTRLAEEAAARELLIHRSTEKKPKLPETVRDPTLVSNVQDLTRLVPTLSARDLSRLADSIKQRRLQIKKPSSSKPTERLQLCILILRAGERSCQ